MFNGVVAYMGQEYAELKRKAISSGVLFRDPVFPPTERSLFLTPGKADGIEWKRPQDICENPRLIVDGVRGTDLIQGDLGNCWLVAACSCLTVNRSLWTQVVVDHRDQDWDTKHAGIFHFRFWRYGAWTDVVIDDFLPTRDGRLVFCQSTSRNEFWSALLEKAYAKLYGSYEAMDGGELAEALEDFTGGVSESYDISDDEYVRNENRRASLFAWMVNLFDAGSLICAAIIARSGDEMEEQTEYGLIKGHAYAVTAIRKVKLAGGGIFNQDYIEMIQLRNPWGPGIEWRGPFSDRSPEWSKISPSEKSSMGLKFADDGDFWMTFRDFCAHFMNVAICHRMNTSLVSLNKSWKETVLHGNWVLPHRVGGCINYRTTFLNNPQYMIEVKEPDQIMIELTQKMLRQPGRDRETIGFTIMRVEENRACRVHVPMPVTVSSTFRDGRSVLLRHSFNRGRYVVVACTFEPGVLGSFMIRFYCGESSTSIRELVSEVPVNDDWSCLPVRRPECVTQIRVVGLYKLDDSSVDGEVETYCVITCDGTKIRSPISKKRNPEWNTYALFYRKNPLANSINVDVFRKSSIGFDELVGHQVFVAAREVFEQPVELPMVGSDNVMLTARLRVVITTSYNLQAV